MASSYNSSPLYAVAIVVGFAVVLLIFNVRRFHRLNKEAQEAEAAGLRRAPAPAASSGAGGGDTTVGPRQQQQPPAPAPAARLTVDVEMASRAAEPVVFTYRKADGWPEAACAVCLAELADGVDVRVLPVCMHYFHAACVGEWLLAHHTCPLCRAPLHPPVAAPPLAAD